MTRSEFDNPGGYGPHIHRQGDLVTVELSYPRQEGNADTVEVEIECVRAADSIRITYDFERDGYVILQAGVFEWEADDKEQDEEWREVAFVQAWASEGVPVEKGGDQ